MILWFCWWLIQSKIKHRNYQQTSAPITIGGRTSSAFYIHRTRMSTSKEGGWCDIIVGFAVFHWDSLITMRNDFHCWKKIFQVKYAVCRDLGAVYFLYFPLHIHIIRLHYKILLTILLTIFLLSCSFCADVWLSASLQLPTKDQRSKSSCITVFKRYGDPPIIKTRK